MIKGYARVSTEGQNLAAQVAQLEAAGCAVVYQETRSGASRRRPELDRLLSDLAAGDVLTVTRLDRLARSLHHLLEIIQQVDRAGARFRSLTEAIDTTSPAGLALMQLVGVFAEFERHIIAERAAAGRDAAQRRGVRFGRPPALTPHQAAEARQMLAAGDTPMKIARLFNVSRSTITRLARRS